MKQLRDINLKELYSMSEEDKVFLAACLLADVQVERTKIIERVTNHCDVDTILNLKDKDRDDYYDSLNINDRASKACSQLMDLFKTIRDLEREASKRQNETEGE